MSSVFTKVINGELPSYKIFENEHVYVFLALHQIQLGHTLIVPKTEVDYFVEVPEPYYTEVFKTAKKVAKAIHAATGCKRVGTMIAGWDVPHFHYHIVPMYDASDLDFGKAGLRNKSEMESIQKKIISQLEK